MSSATAPAPITLWSFFNLSPTGPKTEALLLEGKDPFLLSLAKQKKLFVPFDEEGWAMAKRVGQHTSVILEIARQYSKRTPERTITIRNVPRYRQLVENGVGAYFHDPGKAPKDRVFTN